MFTNCLPVLIYPPRVAELGEINIGGAFFYSPYYARGIDSDPDLEYALFGKIGLSNHFDIGLEVHTCIWPILFSGSIRKQFDFKNSFIQGFSIGASYGYFQNERFMLESSIITKHVSLTNGIAKQKMLSVSSYYLDNENCFFSQLVFDIDINKFHIMPYLYINYITFKDNEESVFYLKSFLDTNNINFSYFTIGLGVILYVEDYIDEVWPFKK